MLPNQYTLELLENEIHEDCSYLLSYCCNADVADELLSKYNRLSSEFSKLDDKGLGLILSTTCLEMKYALHQVIYYGDIVSVSYTNDLVTIVYASGLVSSNMTILAHYYSLENPEVTFVDMEDADTDKGFRVLITHDTLAAFNFCCNCYSHVPENIRNLWNLSIIGEDERLLDVYTNPIEYEDKYAPYTESEYHFTSTL